MKGQEVLFMLNWTVLTTKLIYEDGRLIQALQHIIGIFKCTGLTIPHKERLVITGESFIPTNDFETSERYSA